MPNISVSQEWHHKYLQEIDQFVENHFPTLPAEGPRGSQLKQIQDFLKSAQSMIYDEVLRLTPALKDAGLLDHLKDSYSRHIFTNLDLLLNRDLSVKDISLPYYVGKRCFLQNNISTYLQNILRYDEEHGHNGDSMDEETFIRVH
ncbi:hypothetical protein G5714_013206 [Onychostoma macrolepis]|uniref:Uncharacterized protein n=1 Tax=Onychostoma macrolepis TaxID=369639 RepID=A0A7J6CEN0_9TELE|nr:hypothetical protein G5714_013206 [Onychostoma macrolepis]